MNLNLDNRKMDPSILQAAQRVMAWHLQHTMLPVPAEDASTDDEDRSVTAQHGDSADSAHQELA